MSTTAPRRKTKAPPAMSEAELQVALVHPKDGLATLLGWEHVHFRKAKTERGWRTPGSGQLLKGWPDLVLVRERDSRLIFAELKSDDGELSDDQKAVLRKLNALVCAGGDGQTRVEVAVWRPRDLERIAQVLQ